MTKRTWMYGIALSLCLGAVACGGADNGQQQQDDQQEEETESQSSALINTGLGVTGGACTVTAGPFSGMRGKYDKDGWCCKAQTCVECAAGADGKKRCKDTAKIDRGGPVAPPVGGVLSP